MPASSSAINRQIPRLALISVLANAVLPLALSMALSAHMSALHAVMIVALAPLAESLATLLARRRVDPFGLVVLATLLVGSPGHGGRISQSIRGVPS